MSQNLHIGRGENWGGYIFLYFLKPSVRCGEEKKEKKFDSFLGQKMKNRDFWWFFWKFFDQKNYFPKWVLLNGIGAEFIKNECLMSFVAIFGEAEIDFWHFHFWAHILFFSIISYNPASLEISWKCSINNFLLAKLGL